MDVTDRHLWEIGQGRATTPKRSPRLHANLRMGGRFPEGTGSKDRRGCQVRSWGVTRGLARHLSPHGSGDSGAWEALRQQFRHRRGAVAPWGKGPESGKSPSAHRKSGCPSSRPGRPVPESLLYEELRLLAAEVNPVKNQHVRHHSQNDHPHLADGDHLASQYAPGHGAYKGKPASDKWDGLLNMG